MEAVQGLKAKDWTKVGATTKWSIKDVMAHLASYEHLLVDALNSVVSKKKPTPYLNARIKNYKSFNDNQIAARKDYSVQKTLTEYVKTFKEVEKMIKKISAKLLAKPGTISWYGKQYSLEDFIVYANYAHKCGHVGQIHVFRKRVEI